MRPGSRASSSCASGAPAASRRRRCGVGRSRSARSSAASARSSVARVVAVFDDLLLGSNVLGMLRAAGHDALLAGADAHPDGAAVMIVDVAAGGFDGAA